GSGKVTSSTTKGAFGSTRMAALERVGMVFPFWSDTVVPRVGAWCRASSGTSRARGPTRDEAWRHRETRTLPYPVVVGQVWLTLSGAGGRQQRKPALCPDDVGAEEVCRTCVVRFGAAPDTVPVCACFVRD